MSPVSLACLLPFYLIFERKEFEEFYPANQATSSLIMVVSSVAAVCYNLAHASMIKHITAVATTVIGQIKIVILLVLSAFMLGEGSEFTPKMTVGCVMALAGLAAYGHIKLREAKQQSYHVQLDMSRSTTNDDKQFIRPTTYTTDVGT